MKQLLILYTFVNQMRIGMNFRHKDDEMNSAVRYKHEELEGKSYNSWKNMIVILMTHFLSYWALCYSTMVLCINLQGVLLSSHFSRDVYLFFLGETVSNAVVFTVHNIIDMYIVQNYTRGFQPVHGFASKSTVWNRIDEV